jgi:hypothetical protein
MNAKQIIIAVAALVASVAAEFSLPGTQDGQDWWAHVPGFFSMFGFFVCLILIVFAKGLGSYWLQRPDDYYDREGRDE